MRSIAFVVVSIFAPAVWAGPSPAAASAKKAVAIIGKTTEIPNVAKQSHYAMNELADEVHALSKNERKLLGVLADDEEKYRAKDMDAAVIEEAKPFVEKLCGTSDMTVLGALAPDQVVTKCHLKDHKAVPSVIVKTMRPSAMLYAAFVLDLLGKDATDDERALALWISHYARSDATTAKPIRKP